MSSAPFTGYKSATMDRPLLDQRGVNGQEAQLLEGPSARLPAGWHFADLQLKPNECVRVSACDLSAVFVGKLPLRGPLATWLGYLATGGVSKDQPSRRCVGSSLSGTVAPSPGHQRKRAAKRARNMVPQLRNYMAAIGLLRKGIIAPWILPNKLTGIYFALLGPFSRLGRYLFNVWTCLCTAASSSP